MNIFIIYPPIWSSLHVTGITLRYTCRHKHKEQGTTKVGKQWCSFTFKKWDLFFTELHKQRVLQPFHSKPHPGNLVAIHATVVTALPLPLSKSSRPVIQVRANHLFLHSNTFLIVQRPRAVMHATSKPWFIYNRSPLVLHLSNPPPWAKVQINYFFFIPLPLHLSSRPPPFSLGKWLSDKYLCFIPLPLHLCCCPLLYSWPKK